MANEISIRNNFMNTVMDNEFDAEMAKEMAAQMEGVQMSYPRAKLPAGGLSVFDCGDENPKTLVGIILEQHPINAYWSDPNATDCAPDCSSPDGVIGYNTSGVAGPTCVCKTCPLNQFGSGFGGRGKACSNKVSVFILRDGTDVPTRLDLPATSIKPFNNYMSWLRQNRLLASSVVTEISLEPTMMGSNKVAVAKFKAVERLAPDAAREAMIYARRLRETVRQQTPVEIMDDDPFNV
jgi:hypothetical protein